MPRDTGVEFEVLRGDDAAPGDAASTSPANVIDSDDPVLQRLLEARARVAQGWCTWTMCRELADGRREYCARGAIMPDGGWDSVDRIAGRAEEVLVSQLPQQFRRYGGNGIPFFNNEATQAQVVALFDRAIAARRAELVQP